MTVATFVPIRNAKQTRGAMKGVMDYVSRDDKVKMENEKRLLSGSNCMPRSAFVEMLMTKTRFNKTDGRQFYHFVQSFSADDPITPEEANAIGYEFAQREFPNYEVLIATHIDAEHIHNHLVVNSVSVTDGKKLHQTPEDLKRHRKVNDEICMAHGLVVLPPAGDHRRQRRTKGMSAREYRSAAKGQSWKFEMMFVINTCMRQAKTKREFIERMERKGYKVKWTDTRKNITYTTPQGKACRDDRLHGDKYLKEMMEREFRIREEIIYGRTLAEERAEERSRAFGVEQGGVEDSSGVADGGSGTAGGAEPHSGPYRVEHGDTPQHHYGRVSQEDILGDATGQPDDDNAPTGWETERMALFASEYELGMAEVDTAGAGVDYGVVDSLLRIGKAVERLQQYAPIEDATAMRPRIDSKSLEKLREKRLALGHRLDDHEQKM